MWQERADYGHFFYRIPNGESAADAYDRISGFNESLWRQFGEADFPSVCVLVTHGLMTRVFLMKWYHWSVEYFEDLRNINHCEFILMKQNAENGKYILDNQLRTWSELKRQKAEEARVHEAKRDPQRRNTLSAFLATEGLESPKVAPRKWGGCVGGCDHQHDQFPRRRAEKSSGGLADVSLPPAAVEEKDQSPGDGSHEVDDHPSPTTLNPLPANLDGSAGDSRSTAHSAPATKPTSIPAYLQPTHDDGASTPHERSDEDEYFITHSPVSENNHLRPTNAMASALRPQRKPTPDDIERWASESGMGRGKQADALGDEPGSDDGVLEDGELEDQDGAQVMERKIDAEVEEVVKAEREDRSLRGSVY